MQVANCWLILDKYGSNVPKKNITPAELIILVKDRQDIIGKFPIHNLVVHEGLKSRLTPAQERIRLRHKYGQNKDKKFKIDVVFPGETTKLPETFEETGLLAQSVVNFLAVPVEAPPDVPLDPMQEDEEPVATESVPAVGDVV